MSARGVVFDALAPILGPLASLLHAETLPQAVHMLESEAGIDVVLASVSFDEHRMFDLLRFVRARHPHIPFIACRAAETELNRISLEGVQIASRALGAAAFLDLAKLSAKCDASQLAENVREEVRKHLPDKHR